MNSPFRVFIAVSATFLGVALAPNAANAANTLSGVSVTLISPKPGSVVNPDFPLTITLQLKGGSASTANQCDQESLQDFEFGAQLIDKNNRAQPLSWGIENVDGMSTGEYLFGWRSKVIPGGIECTITTRYPRAPTTPFADFGEGFNGNDADWFGTEQTTWSGDITNFERPVKLDFAWRTTGSIQHTIFTTTSKGSLTAEIEGLTRGQVIDYEATFQVLASFSSTQILDNIGATTGSLREREFLVCDDTEKGMKSQIKDGIISYSITCMFDLRKTNLGEESLIVTPYVSTRYADFSGQPVAINIGKQGIPPCETRNEENNQKLGALISRLEDLQNIFKLTTTDVEGRKILVAIQSLGQDASALSSSSANQQFEVVACKNVQSAISKNVIALSTKLSALNSGVQRFVSSPALQAKAKAQAKANAKKLAADRAAYAKNMNSYGFTLVSRLSASELNTLSIWKFVSPGKKFLNDSQARDWCSQLPRVIIGLPNVVGYPANKSFISGCAEAAKKIRF